MKRCYFCRGEIVKKETSHVHCWGEKMILFKQTPAEVCKQCGEIYFQPEVLKAFDRAVKHLDKIKQTVQIPVVPFPELTSF